jgi:hypothetical protein
MTSAASPVNSNSKDLDPIVPVSTGTSLLKRAVAGSSAAASGISDSNTGAQETGTHIDGATFSAGTATVSALAGVYAGGTVASGKVGVVAINTERSQLVEAAPHLLGLKSTAVNVTSTAGALPSSALASRKEVLIMNNGTATIYVGSKDATNGTVTTSSGLPIAAGASLGVALGTAQPIYGIVASGTVEARVLEMS